MNGPASIAVRDSRRERLGWLGVAGVSLASFFVHPVLAIFGFFALPTALVKLALGRFELAPSATDFADGEVSAIEGGVVLKTAAREVRCVRDDMLDGWLEPWPEPAVVLRTRRALVCVRAGSHARAEAILEACGRSAATNVTRLRIVPLTMGIPLAGTLAVLIGILATFIAVFFGAMLLYQTVYGRPLLGPVDSAMAFLVLAALVALGVAARATTPRLLAIGRDRIVLHGFFGRHTLSVAEVEKIERTPRGLRLSGQGEHLDLPVVTWHQNVQRNPERERLREALFARIGASCKLEASAPPKERLRLLEADGRSEGEHRAALARIAGGEDYRTESLTTPELVAVIGARDVSRPVRLAAAFALSTTDDPHALQRARETLQSIADQPERDETLAALSGSYRS